MKTPTAVIDAQLKSHGYKRKSLYVKTEAALIMCCPNEHTCEISWKNFQKGSRCRTCFPHNVTLVRLKGKLLEFGFEYVRGEFLNTKTKITAKCPVGHEVPISWDSFTQGYRCAKCAGRYRKSTAEVKNILASHGFELISPYKNSYTKLEMICPSGHRHRQQFRNFDMYKACNVCGRSKSLGERELYKWCQELGLVVTDRRKDIISKRELDIYFPDNKLAVEYNGLYWHSEKFCGENYHIDKFTACQERSIQLLSIFEDEWLAKSGQIKILIQRYLGGKFIPAEACKIAALSSKAYLDFTHNYAITSTKPFDFSCGLFTGSDLLGVISFNGECIGDIVFRDILVQNGEEHLIKGAMQLQGLAKASYTVDNRFPCHLKVAPHKIISPVIHYAWGNKRVLDQNTLPKYRRLWDCGYSLYHFR